MASILVEQRKEEESKKQSHTYAFHVATGFDQITAICVILAEKSYDRNVDSLCV